MADFAHKEKQYDTSHPESAAQVTVSSEPVATEPLQYVVSESDLSLPDPEKEPQHNAKRTLTATTTASSLTVETRASVQPKRKKPWYKRLNPLKRSRKPPVPKERTVSREYTAGLLSLLTFQWMAPLMAVRHPSTSYYTSKLRYN